LRAARVRGSFAIEQAGEADPMKPLLMVMLAVQIGIFLAAVYAIVFKRADRPGRPRPIWSSLAFALVIVAATSWQIAEKHAGQPGADLLAYGSPLLLGMGIACALVLIRQRRGLDGPGA
jgi:drug/metabolite transporter (DMT)-like permease